MSRASAVIDRLVNRVNIAKMDLGDDLPRQTDDPLARLLAQDLAPLSVSELHARIAALEGELARTRQKIEGAVNHKATAEALFKR